MISIDGFTTRSAYVFALVLLSTAVVQKSGIIVESDQGVQGPVIELSDSILTDNERLTWWCRENTNIESNTLDKKDVNSENSWTVIADSRSLQQGTGKFTACSDDYMCSQITGTIPWSKDKGGTYRCSAYPNEVFNVIWLNPTVSVSKDGEYDLGETVEFFCEVEMTPEDISYANIMTVSWLRYNPRAYGSQWKPVENNGNTKLLTPQKGSRYGLRITDFSGIADGGDYKCIASIDGYSENLRSEEFAVTSPATSELINDKSDTFEFGLGEEVVISCLVDCYPYPSDILLSIRGKNVAENDPRWTAKTDLYTPEDGKLVAKVTVYNMTADLNDSLVQCRVKRDGFTNYEGRDQKTITLFKEIPKDRVYTPPGQDADDNEYTGPGRPQQKTIQTWIVVLVVIVSLVVLLIVILVVIWRYRVNRESGFIAGNTEDPDVKDSNIHSRT